MQRGMPGGAAGRLRTGGTTGTSASAATGSAADRQPSGTGGADGAMLQSVQWCCAHRHVDSDVRCDCLKVAENFELAHLRKPQESRRHTTSHLQGVLFVQLRQFKSTMQAPCLSQMVPLQPSCMRAVICHISDLPAAGIKRGATLLTSLQTGQYAT